jgi:hypothetical protein
MPSSKVFNGKRYERIGSYGTKREAEAVAKMRKDNGHLARVEAYKKPFGGVSYMVFVKYQYKH